MLYQLQPVPGTATVADAARMQEIAVRHYFLESLRTRDAHPEIPVADIYFKEVCDDAINVARRIFDFWGLPLSDASLQAMTNWNLRNDKNRLGNFRYDPALAQVDQAGFEASIAPYMQQFYPKS